MHKKPGVECYTHR